MKRWTLESIITVVAATWLTSKLKSVYLRTIYIIWGGCNITIQRLWSTTFKWVDSHVRLWTQVVQDKRQEEEIGIHLEILNWISKEDNTADTNNNFRENQTNFLRSPFLAANFRWKKQCTICVIGSRERSEKTIGTQDNKQWYFHPKPKCLSIYLWNCCLPRLLYCD